MQAGRSWREPSNTLTSAESSSEVILCGRMGSAALVVCSRTQDACVCFLSDISQIHAGAHG